MYLKRLSIENVRALSNVSMEFEKGKEAGWHVILGANGSGKSSLIKSLALIIIGEKEAYAARQDFNRWIKIGESKCSISAAFSKDGDYDYLVGAGPWPSKSINGHVLIEQTDEQFGRPVELRFTGERTQRTVWGGGEGWFAASFGPFRRFSGGDRDYDKLFVTNKRLAPHLTAFGEEVALTDAMTWLTSLFSKALREERSGGSSDARTTLDLVVRFLNISNFLAHGARIIDVTDDEIVIKDGNGVSVTLSELSDGYRCALSMVIELLRQMFEMHSLKSMVKAMDNQEGVVLVPGVVAIDEIDTHLHPTWQRDIGVWLRSRFPKIQFIVTTHSPIVCRAIADSDGVMAGTVWKLSSPGMDNSFKKVMDLELEQLVYGDVLDAFSTELFGRNVIRSEAGDNKLNRLAQLNAIAIDRDLSSDETLERSTLRKIFPASAGRLEG